MINTNQHNIKKSSNEKTFDCIEFKRQLQENVLKASKAKNSKEFIDFINKVGIKSSLYKKNNFNLIYSNNVTYRRIIHFRVE
ncbi:hypothetical protein [Methanobrevibacter curvatus]|uniref:Uncharacterized protein n=1 Tax=Methanobrevibacter curvatus TaxID=49547 RepID=A0A166CB81_9EURY|nr:hypothetical protein [Methanobrevibacter curvatus]KZX12807.1 hypothetical protein MBCUR_08630 [Methanobrevibacter curvatus]